MIVIQGNEVDFGAMKLNKSYTKDYTVTNKGDKDLRITSLGQSCTCTKVWMDSSLIKPKQTGIIHITVTPGSTGNFLRSFWFTAGATHTVRLKGQVT